MATMSTSHLKYRHVLHILLSFLKFMKIMNIKTPNICCVRTSELYHFEKTKNTMVADIIKIENLPTFSGQKTDKLIGFSVVGLAKNTLWVMNLSNF